MILLRSTVVCLRVELWTRISCTVLDPKSIKFKQVPRQILPMGVTDYVHYFWAVRFVDQWHKEEFNPLLKSHLRCFPLCCRNKLS